MNPLSTLLRTDEPSARYLLECGSYRDFLKRFFELKKRLNPRYSYTVFARAAAVAKSVPRDVIEGERRLTEKSLPKFLRALDLPGLMEEFFIKLVESETAGANEVYTQKISQMFLETNFKRSFTDDNFKDRSVPFIYAASGKVGEGSTLEVISRRTGLSPGEILEAIPKLEALGLGSYDKLTRRFIPSTSQVHVSSETSRTHFIDFYLYCLGLQQAAVSSKTPPPMDSSLFYNDVFSVNAEDLPKLKEQLEKLVKSFVLKNENPNGNSVAIVNLGLFNHRFESEKK